jgi:hypothetical protein
LEQERISFAAISQALADGGSPVVDDKGTGVA